MRRSTASSFPLVLAAALCTAQATRAQDGTPPAASAASAAGPPPAASVAGPPPAASAAGPWVRIGDIAEVRGVRENALIGTGLVVGLNATGDKARATRQALANLLEKYNLNLDLQDLADGNAALVMVTATLPPFAREGDRIDVTLSATGGATSLFGGTLLFTPIEAADGHVYAVAQGPVSIGGFTASGSAASIAVNHPTVGFISGGATVEEDVDTRFLGDDGTFFYRLHMPDFATASRIAAVLNERHRDAAVAVDPAMVRVTVPPSLHAEELIGFIAQLSAERVVPHAKARVVVNEKTGTIVAGDWVTVQSVAIAHGNLTVTVTESPEVSQPLPYSLGETTEVPRTDVTATVDSGNGMTVLPTTTSVGELAAALNALGATPRDMITILQMLRQAGALHAEIEVL